MTLMDYMYSKMQQQQRQFEAVIHCLKLFGCFPPDMNKKVQKKFIKKHGKYIKDKYNIEFVGF